jgi:hypothetical protein
MTPPRGSYGGGYYSSPFFPDTPIYDSLVAERGTPQIAPIRVPSAYETGSNLPALPAALPALPAGPSQQSAFARPAPAQAPAQPPYQGSQGYQPQQQGGYQQQPGYPQPQAPTPYIPQQATGPRGTGYPAPGYGTPRPQHPSYGGQTGYDTGAARPVPPRPVPPRPAAPQQGGYYSAGQGYDEQPYQRRNLGGGPQYPGGYQQG